MSLFQNSVLRKHLASQNTEACQAAYDLYLHHFHNPRMQAEIRGMKEEEYQDGFLSDLFVKILGYTKRPNEGYDLIREKKNETDSKKADGAILRPDGSVIAIIELKGTDTKDLSKVNDQAFRYQKNHPDCPYVITSNFEKLRFFIDNAVEHEEFNLFTLTQERFSLLWLCLQKDNLQADLPKKVKVESLLEEERVTKLLYKDYSAFKSDLWQDMCQQNPEADELELYKKSQKLLDRFLFIFFAEDKGLLPPNSITQIVKEWAQLKELDAYSPLYDRIKLHFGYMNNGRPRGQGKEEIYAYNGGLFRADALLDALTISDDVLKKYILKLTEYDFDTEVDTNILGHIFEHSLNDIENVRAQLAGEELDKSKTKRKKDGVFYTPKYITKYIVDNTVGKLCREKKTKIGIDSEEYAKDRKGRRTETLKRLDDQLKQYREWLLQLTICDPACGSGAFLNQTLEFLIAEHHYVDELESQLLGYAMVFQDVENHILERNLFGVDINEESVEIARLSLWLRTAQKGRKLTSLSSNIKVGNSLIDDPEEAGDLAFNWQEQFPTVFEKGGFDVVIGNPPYVSHDRVNNKKFLQKNYESHQGFADLLCYFFELGEKILDYGGTLSFITSNSFLKADYGAPLRRFLKKKTTLLEVINLEDAQIFMGAIVNSCILTFSKGIQANAKCLIVNKRYDTSSDFIYYVESNKFFYQQDDFDELPWNLISTEALQLRKKIKGSHPTLETLKTKIRLGIATGSNEAFVVDRLVRDKILSQDPNSIEIIKPILRGKDIGRYSYQLPSLWVLLTRNGIDIELTYPAVYAHLDAFGEKFKNRGAKGKHWTNLRACSFFDDFREEKIVWIELSDKGRFARCTEEVYALNSAYFLLPPDGFQLGYLLGILNSRVIQFYLQQIANTSGVGTTRWINIYVKQFPIPNSNKEIQASLNSMVEEFESKKDQILKTTDSFLQLIESKCNSVKPTSKLKNWPQLNFKDFLIELKKSKMPAFSLKEEAEWMEYFGHRKSEANALQIEIDRIDKRIDQMVYELYGLSDEEINDIESS